MQRQGAFLSKMQQFYSPGLRSHTIVWSAPCNSQQHDSGCSWCTTACWRSVNSLATAQLDSLSMRGAAPHSRPHSGASAKSDRSAKAVPGTTHASLLGGAPASSCMALQTCMQVLLRPARCTAPLQMPRLMQQATPYNGQSSRTSSCCSASRQRTVSSSRCVCSCAPSCVSCTAPVRHSQ